MQFFSRDAGQAVVQNAFCEPGRPDHNQAKVNIRVYSRNWWSLRLESTGEIFSVADPGCLSRIPDPDFYPSRIPDPKTAMKDRGEKKFVVIPFFGDITFKKLNYFIFEMLKKKNLGQFSKNYRTFYPKNCH